MEGSGCFGIVPVSFLIKTGVRIVTIPAWPVDHMGVETMKVVSAVLPGLVLVACSGLGPVAVPPLTVTVVDVGQGTSVIVEREGRAFVSDMGPRSAKTAWRRAWRGSGRPVVGTVAISHRDEDHAGGLNALDMQVAWEERVVLSPWECVESIRAYLPLHRNPDIREVAAGDTIYALEGVWIECLWPPRDTTLSLPLTGVHINRFSLCFQIRFHHTTVLLTGDIDTVAQRIMAQQYGWSLRSTFFVVPHHGSAGSVSERFWGYVAADMSVISCGADNRYGHPSAAALDLLFTLGSSVHVTAHLGGCTGISNGEYWVWESEW